ncbi:MAG: histidine--tRNA ligase [Bacteroidetes bacterium RIFOXYA12_FULL_35_11]|nr:MAG: histidine--tRNA ligase [Bacteroidetes bacterium GWF2_35_48]OFY82595.1 MAG: histidine--tRNA ligase [Bacteroidetes bacterium RIFOXYA12_FULL_35_11]OFY92487.1 MAG: histidine--tRNA ligase [Bacteroidetes bacterium RIFOXYC12_FULL_35_7]HBX49477.1 histidine--tRNA ligase [Bacteroidales bacterium]
MSDLKLGIPKGTRDFSPSEMVRRNFIFDTLKKIFQKYGYLPIETPAMENITTLTGKYGDEGDQLIFKILNSRIHESKNKDLLKEEFEKSLEHSKNSEILTEKALRYDLTVPFARYVVQHRNDITFPFKRYQMQPVWRADRPQKGRYREFYQCDVDVIGSKSLLNEVELLQIIDEVFNEKNLNVPVLIKLNNRKILSGIAEVIGAADKIIDITVAIDKLDKIGLVKVNEELRQKNVSEEAISTLQPIIKLSGSLDEKMIALKYVLASSIIGLEGISEIQKVFKTINTLNIKTDVEFDVTLARGLNYYTGAIFEVKAKDVEIGSICGGGRYDDLTGIFGMKDVSGVGVSFGADRIYDVMLQTNKFPAEAATLTKLMFVNFGDNEEKYCLGLLAEIRSNGISAEIYPDQTKMKKQLDYANNKGIAYVALVGENEINENLITLKNMNTGEQKKLSVAEVIQELNEN